MLQTSLRNFFEWLDRYFNKAFTPANNPMLQLGAMGWFFFWIVTVSGVYLYIFFDTGVTGAYQSVEYLTNSQWYAGGVMRSLHRYASDALVIVVILHLLRETAMDRMHGPRFFTWITGVLLLWFLYVSGITGYWIVWDKFAQYVAITTTEWLDSLNLFGEPIARNFLHESTLNDRFFTLFVFIHIVVPLFMLFLMWIHILRVSRPEVNPPKRLALSTLTALLLLSLIYPAVSQGPANLNQVPAIVGLDWYYFAFYPLLDHYDGLLVWALLAATTLILLMFPWLLKGVRKKHDVAVVDLENCNGCSRCAFDCPYSAITMVPRSDSRPYSHEAAVNASLCVSCGICAGACPTSTPFRRRGELIPGIQIPSFSILDLREEIIRASEQLEGDERLLIIGCESGPDLNAIKNKNTGTVVLPCVGMLPPVFIDFILSRDYTDGVLLTGCADHDCYHRLGIVLTEMRIDRTRDPKLRHRVPRQRLDRYWCGKTGIKKLSRRISLFRQQLRELPREQLPDEKQQCMN